MYSWPVGGSAIYLNIFGYINRTNRIVVFIYCSLDVSYALCGAVEWRITLFPYIRNKCHPLTCVRSYLHGDEQIMNTVFQKLCYVSIFFIFQCLFCDEQFLWMLCEIISWVCIIFFLAQTWFWIMEFSQYCWLLFIAILVSFFHLVHLCI